MRILVADKDPSLRTLILTRLVARHYEVLETESSDEVMRIIERQAIDLILISTDMERIGGSLLIEIIRKKSQ